MSSLLKDQSMSKEEGMERMLTEVRKGASQLMAEWCAAYRAANGAEPPPVKYASGWFYFNYDNYHTAHRRKAVERMIRTLRDRVPGSLELSRGETEGLDGGHP